MRDQRFYRNKPYVPVRINRDHPYSKHLIFAIDPLQGELAHGDRINYVGGYSKVATAGGGAYTTTTAQYGEVSDHSGIQNTGELFIYAVVAGAGVASIHKTATDGLTNSELDLWCNLSYNSNTFHFGRANTADRWWRGNIPVAANTINVFSVSAQSAMEAAVTAGLNGSSVTMSTDGTGTGANNLSGNPIRLNRRNGSISSNEGVLLFAAAFRRNLGAEGHVLFGNNPYDIVEPIRKIFTFYSTGTTPVTSDLDVKWNILSPVTSNLDARWNALSSVTSDIVFQWDVQSSLAAVTSDLGIQWDIRSAVASDCNLQWSMLQAVQSDIQARWNILSQVLDDVSIRWNVISVVQSDITLQWTILSGDSTPTVGITPITGYVTINPTTGYVGITKIQ